MSVTAVAAVVGSCLWIGSPAYAAPQGPAGPADGATAADQASAAAIARKYHHPVTDLSSLTETTKVEALPDGTEQLTISTEPARVRKGGAWADIDTRLGRAADGMLSPSAAATPVEFSRGGFGPLARVQTTTGKWVSVASPVAELPAGVVDGSSVTYPDVLPGVDLKLTATVSGMSEVLIIGDAAAAANPALADLRFAVSGASVGADRADGAAKAATSDGSALVSPTPTWWDSSDGGTADRPGGAGLTRPVKGGASGNAVFIDAGDAARTPGVTYPVFVDPDFTGGTQAWTFVDSRYPTASYWLGSNHGSDNEAHVGYISATYSSDGAHTDRTFWQLDTSALAGKHILAAHFDTQEIYSSACTSNAFSLYITGGISPGTTWNAQPGFLQRVSGAVLGPQRSNCPNQYGVGFDAMGVANWAAQNGNAAMTVALRADNEGDFTTWRRFLHGATMTVTYNTVPNAPSGPWDAGSPCSTTSPGKVLHSSAASPVTLGVSASDPDGGNVHVMFYVAKPDGSNALPSNVYPNGYIDGGTHGAGAFNVQVLSQLPDGNYKWDAWDDDGIDRAGPSPMCYFQINNDAPAVPTVTVSATDNVVVGSTIDVSISDPSATDVLGYVATWQPSANAPTYSQLPPCQWDNLPGGMHWACGSSLTGTISPETAPTATLTVWAFDTAGNRSQPMAVTVSTVAADPAALASSAHQWTTDLVGPVPASSCPVGTSTVDCVADNNVPDPSGQPNGQFPIGLVPGVTLDGSGNTAAGGIAGVLNFDGSSTSQMTSSPAMVVDTTKSFTVGAWITPTAVANGNWQAAVSERGGSYSGLVLGLDDTGHWCVVASSTTSGTGGEACSSTVATSGKPVYVAGIYDAANHEVRLYLNGALMQVVNYWADSSPSAADGLTLGSAWWEGAATPDFVGQLGNPVVLQGVLTGYQLTQLANESFFTSDLG